MTRLVVGTAGHIDHGKSTLVHALTGIDPDRLKEEKARGITIELGFAHARIDEARIAFVDVPGHEKFVRTMLAGVGGVDFVMLVIAADESVMPQTREHFDICRLLHVVDGCVVITKADAADADTRALVALEASELVRGSFLDGKPIVQVSARTGEGLDELRGVLRAAAARAQARPESGAVRLPIDRVFTMKGFGTVVTGTLVAGRIDDRARICAAAWRAACQGARHPGARGRPGVGERGAARRRQPGRRRGRRPRSRPDLGRARHHRRDAKGRRAGGAPTRVERTPAWRQAARPPRDGGSVGTPVHCGRAARHRGWRHRAGAPPLRDTRRAHARRPGRPAQLLAAGDDWRGHRARSGAGGPWDPQPGRSRPAAGAAAGRRLRCLRRHGARSRAPRRAVRRRRRPGRSGSARGSTTSWRG